MASEGLYKITDINGYTPAFSRLVSMMNYARHTTLEAVRGLRVDELDYLDADASNSIGALLLHIAAVEFGFQIEFFEKRKPNEQEISEWGAAYGLGDKARCEIKGYPLEFYVEKMDSVRRRTLEEFKKREDDWLTVECVWDGQPSNHHFIWFHVFEDEINHRGQIRILRKRLQQHV